MQLDEKNIKAIRKLANRYEKITLEDIKDTHLEILEVAHKLTGFHSFNTCGVCISTTPTDVFHVNRFTVNCSSCAYRYFSQKNQITTNLHCVQQKTWQDIQSADTPKELLLAFHARAKYIKEQLKLLTGE